MECPYCHNLVEKGKRVCPSCDYPLLPERRKKERRGSSKSSASGADRRKKDRRRDEDPVAWGL